MSDDPVRIQKEDGTFTTPLVEEILEGELVVVGKPGETIELIPDEPPKEYPRIEFIDGGEGMSTNSIRRLVAFVVMPDRRNLEWQARNMLRESDIREAMAQGARKLWNHYVQRDYGNVGFVFDPDQIEYDIARLEIGMDIGADTAIKHTEGLARTLVATVVIRR
jgi:hypothetical protein